MPTYPESTHCRMTGYPQKIRVMIDARMAEETPYAYKQCVVLQQTFNSFKLQGSYVKGEELPVYRAIYSDTGSDDNYDLKVTFGGWGTYYIKNSSDKYYSIERKRIMTVQVSGWDDEKIFSNIERIYTSIPVSKSIADIEPPEVITEEISDTEVEPPEDEDESDYDDGSGDGGDDRLSCDRWPNTFPFTGALLIYGDWEIVDKQYIYYPKLKRLDTKYMLQCGRNRTTVRTIGWVVEQQG